MKGGGIRVVVNKDCSVLILFLFSVSDYYCFYLGQFVLPCSFFSVSPAFYHLLLLLSLSIIYFHVTRIIILCLSIP